MCHGRHAYTGGDARPTRGISRDAPYGESAWPSLAQQRYCLVLLSRLAQLYVVVHRLVLLSGPAQDEETPARPRSGSTQSRPRSKSDARTSGGGSIEVMGTWGHGFMGSWAR